MTEAKGAARGSFGVQGHRFLTDAELADIDSRNAAANGLRNVFGLGGAGESELERLVAEVRYWRSKWASAASARNAPPETSRAGSTEGKEKGKEK